MTSDSDDATILCSTENIICKTLQQRKAGHAELRDASLLLTRMHRGAMEMCDCSEYRQLVTILSNRR